MCCLHCLLKPKYFQYSLSEIEKIHSNREQDDDEDPRKKWEEGIWGYAPCCTYCLQKAADFSAFLIWL